MPVFRYDTKLKQMVQISEKSFRNSNGHIVSRPMAEQVMEGYKRLEARGDRVYGNPAEIKRLWSK